VAIKQRDISASRLLRMLATLSKSLSSLLILGSLPPEKQERCYMLLDAREFAVSSAVVWNSLPAELRVSSLTVATCQTLKGLLVFLPELTHLMTLLFCAIQMRALLYYYHYCYYY